MKKAQTVSEMSASACGDGTRLLFVRSDLLLWSQSSSDFNLVRRCDGYTTLSPFAHRASRDADVLVLGLGHHFPGSLDFAVSRQRGGPLKGTSGPQQQVGPHPHSLTLNLNLTLTLLNPLTLTSP